MWSALEELQMEGRLYRRLQRAWVLIYNLVVTHSPDVFLNNLSFSKGMMHSAFLTASPAVRECFVSYPASSISHITFRQCS